MVYLIHFNSPVSHARHVIVTAPICWVLHRDAFTPPPTREWSLFGAAIKAGIEWTVSRTWHGGEDTARDLRRQNNTPRLCPTCSGRSSDASD